MRVGFIGATGRVGKIACRALVETADLELVGAVASPASKGIPLTDVAPGASPDVRLSDNVEDLVGVGAEVVIDFSVGSVTLAAAELLLPQGVHLVSGTTGLADGDLARLADLAQSAPGNAIWAANFALGAVLAGHFAAVAAHYFAAAEVVEMHHAAKLDAPSGTAIQTALAIAQARIEGASRASAVASEAPTDWEGCHREVVPGARGGSVEGVRVHAVRLPGLLAHQEVLFGGDGEVLTIRHDALDRAAFIPGVVRAVRSVSEYPGLTIGLETLLGLVLPTR